MAQTPAARVYDGDSIPYTPPSTAVNAGDVVVQGSFCCIANDPIAVSALGSLFTNGVYDVPKDTSTFSAGDLVYWNATGNPVTGTAGTGACTSTASGNVLIGLAMQAQLTGDAYIRLMLNQAIHGSTTGGAMTADSITGTSSTLPIQGLGAAQGGSASLIGGTSSTSGNAGGAVLVTGGTPGATGVGGPVTIAAGAGGATSGNGGVASMTGGAGTNGNAAGGAVNFAGGAGNGTGNGGLGSLIGGASAQEPPATAVWSKPSAVQHSRPTATAVQRSSPAASRRAPVRAVQ